MHIKDTALLRKTLATAEYALRSLQDSIEKESASEHSRARYAVHCLNDLDRLKYRHGAPYNQQHFNIALALGYRCFNNIEELEQWWTSSSPPINEQITKELKKIRRVLGDAIRYAKRADNYI